MLPFGKIKIEFTIQKMESLTSYRSILILKFIIQIIVKDGLEKKT